MNDEIRRNELAKKVAALYRLADEIHGATDDFPAINRNAVRVLAAARAMKMNLEIPQD